MNCTKEVWKIREILEEFLNIFFILLFFGGFLFCFLFYFIFLIKQYFHYAIFRGLDIILCHVIYNFIKSCTGVFLSSEVLKNDPLFLRLLGTDEG